MCRSNRFGGLGKECCYREDSADRGSRSHGVLCSFRFTRFFENQIAHIDNPRKPAQPGKKVQNVEVGTIGLEFKGHFEMEFPRDDGLRRQPADADIGGASRRLKEPDKFIGFFLFRHDGLEGVQLLLQSFDVSLEVRIPPLVHLHFRHFFLQVIPLLG